MILLATHAVTLVDSEQRDAHGWTLPGSGEPVWSGWGSLQAASSTAARDASTGGGHGPGEPATRPPARLFLPLSAPARPGMTAHVTARAGRGLETPEPESWTVGAVWDVCDPTGGALGARVAECVRKGGGNGQQ